MFAAKPERDFFVRKYDGKSLDQPLNHGRWTTGRQNGSHWILWIRNDNNG